jgi:zinc transport system ATP-binding protein
VRAADREHVRAAIEAVGLTDRARDSVASLSGGQQQRVLIARALAGDPDLLVLDEPTAGVDLTHQDALADVVGRLVDRGRTIVLVAHEIGPLEPLIARTVVMRDGRVAYDGPPLPTFQHTPHDHHHPHEDARRTSPHRVELGTPIDRGTQGGRPR